MEYSKEITDMFLIRYRELETIQRQSSQNTFDFYGGSTRSDDDGMGSMGGRSFNLDDYI